MNRLAASLLMLFLPTAWAASEMAWVLPAGQTAGPPPHDPADPAWARVPATRVVLYPQVTAPGGPGGVLEMEARALQGNGRLALHLAWPDATADVADSAATHRFADAVAIQFAGSGTTLPYVGMGEPDRPVQVWLWRAGRPVERLSAWGFGSLATQAGAAPEAVTRRTATGWEVVLRGEAGNAIAAAIAAWDGAEDGRAGRKRLSAWRVLGSPGAALTEESRVGGDAKRGERLYTEHGCAACHAPGAGLGPDLSHAGGIHWPGYLRRALHEPAAFLVPGYAAIMPAPSLPPEELEDLVAYLMTLR